MAGGDARRPPLHGNQLSQAHRGADGFLSDRRQETGDRGQDVVKDLHYYDVTSYTAHGTAALRSHSTGTVITVDIIRL